MSPLFGSGKAALQSSWTVAGLVLCPRCRKDAIQFQNEQFQCAGCSARFSYRDSVLNTLTDESAQIQPPDVAPVAKAIMARYGIPDTPAMLERVADVIHSSRTASDKNSPISSEIGHFIDRFQLNNIDYKCELVRHYIEPVLPVDTVLHRCIRVRNSGHFSWSSEGPQPVLLSYHWLGADGRHTVHFEGQRTAFPIDISPGREITIPLRIQTPNLTGSHILQVLLVHEQVRWAQESSMLIPVDLRKGSLGASVCKTVPAEKLPPFHEVDDSKIARSMILDQLLQRPGRGVCTFVEVGGGSSPECLELMAENKDPNLRLLNVDVSESLLRLLSMNVEHNRPELFDRTSLLCADAMTLGFTRPFVDGVVICRALHHFPDPIGLLRRMREWLAPTGFVAVVCEPVGSAYSEAGVFSLKAGVNEQVFSTDEYSRMFKEAGFTIVSCRVDWGFSLKAILRLAS